MNSPIIWDFHKRMYIYAQISPTVQNIQNPRRDTTEILKLCGLGMRLLSNPNKYEYCLLLPSTEYLKVWTVGAFSAYKIHFAPILPIIYTYNNIFFI